ncbi:MAG: Asp-tRNA(Asn)/Glu-tRNA(Gln) amidotransferase subunit GatB [Deinococcota bacterium]
MYEAVVGLEIHLALDTESKIFSAAKADSFGEAPNVNIDPISLGLPGTLPVVNERVIDKAIMFSLAVNCDVPDTMQFHRKHYFYPDLPKNYQISQYDRPVGEHGFIVLENGKRIGITRCHIEEDAGKSVHPTYADYSLVDLNRTGAPLIEMVTEPDIRTGDEAREFLTKVRAIAQALGVSRANPEEGKMRADVNISVHLPDQPFGTKVEVKNLNSFQSVERAIEFEQKRQTRLIEAGGAVQQSTLGWDEGGQKTYLMRVKEGEADYRYFPEPDMPPIVISQEWLAKVCSETPELPDAKLERYLALGVRDDDAKLIAYNVDVATVFDAAISTYADNPQALANWLNSDIQGWLNGSGQSWQESSLQPAHLASLVKMIDAGAISGRTAKDILPEVMTGRAPEQLVEERGLKQMTDTSAIAKIVDEIINANPKIAANVAENPKAINALLGQVMKASKGKAKPDVVRALLQEKLGVVDAV